MQKLAQNAGSRPPPCLRDLQHQAGTRRPWLLVPQRAAAPHQADKQSGCLHGPVRAPRLPGTGCINTHSHTLQPPPSRRPLASQAGLPRAPPPTPDPLFTDPPHRLHGSLLCPADTWRDTNPVHDAQSRAPREGARPWQSAQLCGPATSGGLVSSSIRWG